MYATHAVKSILLSCLFVAAVPAEDAKPQVDKGGDVTSVSAQFPFPKAASPQALTRFRELMIEYKETPGFSDPLASRKFYGKINDDRAERMKKLYPVQIKAAKIA